MQLDDVTRDALEQAALEQGVSVTGLVERLVLDAARQQTQADLAVIDSIAAARAKLRPARSGQVLPFRRPIQAAARA